MKMPKISYGSIAAPLILIYFGLILILWSLGIKINPLTAFSGFFLTLAIWTLTYGFKYVPQDRYWTVNGSILLVISTSLFTYSLTGSGTLSLGILLLCLGFIVILLVFLK